MDIMQNAYVNRPMSNVAKDAILTHQLGNGDDEFIDLIIVKNVLNENITTSFLLFIHLHLVG